MKKLPLPIYYIGALLLLFFLWDFLSGINYNGSNNTLTIRTTAADTFFHETYTVPGLNDSMPYYLHKKIDDSINQIRQLNERYNDGVGATGYSFGGFGVRKLDADWYSSLNTKHHFTDSVEQDLFKEYDRLNGFLQSAKDSGFIRNYKDSIAILNKKINLHHDEMLSHRNDGEKTSYFFILTGYELKNNSQFFIKNGTYYLSYVVADSANGTENQYGYGHNVYKKVNYRYNSKEKIIMIPVSEKKYKILDIGLKIFGGLWFAVGILMGIIYPWRILRNISKGDVFTEENISRLNWLGIYCLLFFTANFLFKYFLRWLFNDIIPVDFTSEPFIKYFIENMYSLLGTAVVFLIGIAFKRGYNLQEEQSLII